MVGWRLVEFAFEACAGAPKPTGASIRRQGKTGKCSPPCSTHIVNAVCGVMNTPPSGASLVSSYGTFWRLVAVVVAVVAVIDGGGCV